MNRDAPSEMNSAIKNSESLQLSNDKETANAQSNSQSMSYALTLCSITEQCRLPATDETPLDVQALGPAWGMDDTKSTYATYIWPLPKSNPNSSGPSGGF